MKKFNLLKEVLECLELHGKTQWDVDYCSVENREGEYVLFYWEIFKSIAEDIDYLPEFNAINSTLKIVGDGWWIQRAGSTTSWEYIELPIGTYGDVDIDDIWNTNNMLKSIKEGGN